MDNRWKRTENKIVKRLSGSSKVRIRRSLEGGEEMPLTFAKEGECTLIKKIGGREDTRQFLENLGFVAGAAVTVISTSGGSLIVNIRDSRIAIGKDMACRIMV